MATRRYESYLLRLWESDEDGQLIWRAVCTQRLSANSVFRGRGRLLALDYVVVLTTGE